ncbi:hypothetical protein GE061_000203 [Apolygus lucorum]|uniref:DUF7041 domain-containing protein n=1 Tax=Apolygus lucorum TaxID=248454 RepID=A0A8S9Y5N6_APOLU|nr:hypothetical protein GE061_000203 [Apolygus lucorum]
MDDTDQYDIVVNALDNCVLVHVTDLLAKPPLTNKYEALKTRLIEAFVYSDDKQLQRPLRETVIGDKRPTYLLREMRELAGNKASNDLLKSLWLHQLPSNVLAPRFPANNQAGAAPYNAVLLFSPAISARQFSRMYQPSTMLEEFSLWNINIGLFTATGIEPQSSSYARA